MKEAVLNYCSNIHAHVELWAGSQKTSKLNKYSTSTASAEKSHQETYNKSTIQGHFYNFSYYSYIILWCKGKLWLILRVDNQLPVTVYPASQS